MVCARLRIDSRFRLCERIARNAVASSGARLVAGVVQFWRGVWAGVHCAAGCTVAVGVATAFATRVGATHC